MPLAKPTIATDPAAIHDARVKLREYALSILPFNDDLTHWSCVIRQRAEADLGLAEIILTVLNA